jgi:hypothetical protein
MESRTVSVRKAEVDRTDPESDDLGQPEAHDAEVDGGAVLRVNGVEQPTDVVGARNGLSRVPHLGQSHSTTWARAIRSSATPQTDVARSTP